MLFFIKNCVKFLLYNHPDQTFLNFKHTITDKNNYICDFECIPEWITYENTTLLYNRKNEEKTYNPFFIKLHDLLLNLIKNK